MHHRVDILRVPPAPRASHLYVYRTGTNIRVQLYADKDFTEPISQPYLMELENMHWYCAENVRVDIRILSHVYPDGYILIKDQMMINPETIANINYTMVDGTVCLDSNGNMYQEAIL